MVDADAPYSLGRPSTTRKSPPLQSPQRMLSDHRNHTFHLSCQTLRHKDSLEPRGFSSAHLEFEFCLKDHVIRWIGVFLLIRDKFTRAAEINETFIIEWMR